LKEALIIGIDLKETPEKVKHFVERTEITDMVQRYLLPVNCLFS